MTTDGIHVGRQYRFKNDGTTCQVLRIDEGGIPVFDGYADLEIGILDGPNMGMQLTFGTLARFAEAVA